MIDKTATTDFPITDVIAKRWSPRAFADKSVSDEILRSLFEAARWAPSAFNEQPWRFLVAQKEDAAAYENMLACLGEYNQIWAKAAPVLMIVVAKTTFTRNGKPNQHAWYDTGQAMAALTVQASSMELYLHQMAGFSAEAARETYGIPEGYEPIAAVALGYLGDPAQLSEKLQERERGERVRHPLPDFVFTDWEESF